MISRVLHVTEALGGGITECVALDASEAVRRGAHVTVLYAPRPQLDSAWCSRFPAAAEMVETPVSLKPGPAGVARTIRWLRDFARRQRPDLVHLHSSWAGFIGRIALGRHFPVAYTPQAFAFLRRDMPLPLRAAFWCGEWSVARLGTIVACSPSEARHARRLAPADRVAMVENGIRDHPAFGEPLSRVTQDDAPPLVIGCGRLDPQKDPLAFVSILAAVRTRVPRLRAAWVGRGPLHGDVRAAAERVGLSLDFHDWMDRDSLFRLVAGAAAQLHTARWEGMPLTLLESMAVGVPVVGRRIDGVHDVLKDGRTGFLFDRDEDAVTALVTLLRDEARRTVMAGEAKREFAARFSQAVHGQALWACYDAIVARWSMTRAQS